MAAGGQCKKLEGMTLPLLLVLGLFIVLDLLLLWRGCDSASALPLLVISGLLALRPNLETSRRIVLALMAAALGLTLLVEIVVLDGDISRMNTVFKFYLQVWLMLSIACAVAAIWAWPAIASKPRLRPVWTTIFAVLVAAALLYPLTATPAKWRIRMNPDAPNTLNGMAFMPYVEYGDTDYMGNPQTVRLADDYGAILWMQRNIEGSPVIAEATTGNYYRSIANRVAMYTGLPDIVGWDWHQRQQRAVVPNSMVSDRATDVNSLYNDGRYSPGQSHSGQVRRQLCLRWFTGKHLLPAGRNPPSSIRWSMKASLTEVYRDDAARIYRLFGPTIR
ncbi:MAG: DUF2298 domain-containing protein [Chloroflexota bacterium]